jgi:uncharacterized protein YjbI with pentapeptide repeats
MANEEHLALLRQGVAAWNRWRKEHDEPYPDLSRANLRQVRLNRANLHGADLRGANLSQASLVGANLCFSNLTQASLSRAHLRGAYLGSTTLTLTNLSGADLRQAHLDGAKLLATDLSEANLSEASLYSAYLNEVNLSGADLSGAKLTRAQLVKTNLTNATLTQCSVYGIALWNVQLEGAIQENLIITPDNEPTIAVDDLEMAQFASLLLSHNKLRTSFNSVTERGVLLLGHFRGGGLETLQAVAARLREERYLPIMLDLDRPDDRTHRATVQTLAGLSRFIVADVSGPSIAPELYATVPHCKRPFVPILEAGREPFAMAVDLLEYPWVVRPTVIFTSIEELVSLVFSKIIAPAEEKHQARQQLLNELFHSE